jgi:hypothetical protein
VEVHPLSGEHAKQEDREVAKRSLESGQLVDDTVVENFAKRTRTSNDHDLFDNKEVHKAVHMTTECGENYIRTKPGGVKEPGDRSV